MQELRIPTLCPNICVWVGGDRLTRAAKSGSSTQDKPAFSKARYAVRAVDLRRNGKIAVYC